MRIITSCMLIFLFPLSDAFSASCDVDLNLEGFHKNTKEFMARQPLKLDGNCNKVTKSLFTEEEITSREFITIKDNHRKSFCHFDAKSGQRVCLKDILPGRNVPQGRAGMNTALDNPHNIINGDITTRSALEMNSLKLQRGSVQNQPWSDFYWPIGYGQLSYRYMDDDFISTLVNSNVSTDGYWPFVNTWLNNNPALMTDLNLLSPAEKYDILVGDDNFTFSKAMLRSGKRYFSKQGKVESWMGICHGWAPASFMLPRPKKTISIESVDGKEVMFKPSDIKALGSQLWASGIQRTKFVGGRCNTKEPAEGANGRVLDQNCFDTNPGAFHIALINQVGVNKKSFVMDATYDYQVWNFPVTSYSYKYINPSNMKEYRSVKKNIISKRKFRNDKFKAYRSPEAVYIVGVQMEIEYAVETLPSKESSDDESFDKSHTVHYVYDLELDQNMNIIGGEWYQNTHPDFLWAPEEDSNATSSVDEYLPGVLDLKNLKDTRLKELAPFASERLQPVGQLIKAMFNKASKH